MQIIYHIQSIKNNHDTVICQNEALDTVRGRTATCGYVVSYCCGGARSHHSRGVEKKDLVLPNLPRPAAMESNGNTPLPEDMNKPPEGMVLPPKDIKGACLP
jgi:hypothetical protein